jgi:hypothetical protein
MATLLVLGSKPSPRLPSAACFDAVACANASVVSAARLQLPVPVHTVMTALITNNSELGRLQLQALRGLETQKLFYIPRRIRGSTAVKRLTKRVRDWRLQSLMLKWQLKRVAFRYEEFVCHDAEFYTKLAGTFASSDDTLVRQTQAKSPSTGMISLLMGLADGRFDRFVMAGFSFERTQAVAAGSDQLLDGEGGPSPHARTDLLLLHRLRERHVNIITTEPLLAKLAALPVMSA